MWTYALIILTIHPNHTVNRIIDTEAFDDGAFWLLIEPPKELVVLGVAGFALMFAGYVSVILRFMWRDKSATPRHTPIQKVYVGRVAEPFKSAVRNISDTSKSGSLKKNAAVIVSKLSNKENSTRKFAVSGGLRAYLVGLACSHDTRYSRTLTSYHLNCPVDGVAQAG
jgi:hypothetical protein